MKFIYGMGVNDSTDNTHIEIAGKLVMCPIQSRWRNMLNRCYSSQYHLSHPSYKECVVSDEWLLFSKFKLWMESQDWEGKHLDKDLLVKGNKVYGPDTCLFVSPEVNSFFNGRRSNRFENIGVNWHKATKKYVARVRDTKGGRIFLGYFTNEDDAVLAYENGKRMIGEKLASVQSDKRISAAILRHI